jgi:hypothetical protein
MPAPRFAPFVVKKTTPLHPPVKKLIYSLIVLLVAVILWGGLRSAKSDSDFDIEAFAELPVQVGGRIKPLDSVARNTLLVLSGRQKVVTTEGATLTPIQWFIDLTMRPELADRVSRRSWTGWPGQTRRALLRIQRPSPLFRGAAPLARRDQSGTQKTQSLRKPDR